jgi:Tfp pilus assembly protein PilF
MNKSVELAIRYVEDGALDQAKFVIGSELEEHPEEPLNWLVMGAIQANQGDYGWAAQSFEKYLQCVEAKFSVE